MSSMLLSFERHASRFAAVALLGMTLVTACDDDRPTAPAPTAAAPTTPSSARYISTGIIVWKVIDSENQSLLGGAKFEIDGGPNNIQWVMTDNNAGDVDLVSGQFKFAGLAPGSYKVCEIGAPAGFAVEAPKCKTANVNAGAITDIGTFLNGHLPNVSDGYWDYAKNYVGGGAYMVKDSVGAVVMTIVDNGVLDLDKADGKFTFLLPSAGTFQICERTPPPGWYFPTGQVSFCVTKTFTLNMGSGMGPNMVVPPYSAVWSVISGFYPPNNSPGWLGPSTFTVTKTDGSFSTTIVDNGAGDLHNMLGIFYVKLPSGGDYTICQSTKITGYYLPNPLCHTVTANFGKVTWGDYFINGEEQVIYNP